MTNIASEGWWLATTDGVTTVCRAYRAPKDVGGQLYVQAFNSRPVPSDCISFDSVSPVWTDRIGVIGCIACGSTAVETSGPDHMPIYCKMCDGTSIVSAPQEVFDRITWLAGEVVAKSNDGLILGCPICGNVQANGTACDCECKTVRGPEELFTRIRLLIDDDSDVPQGHVQPWREDNGHGETPGMLCCQRAASEHCYEHTKSNWKFDKGRWRHSG